MDTSRKTSRYADLAGKTVFISGGGSGIGAALTRAFAEQGARVGFVDIAEEASLALCVQIRNETGTAPLFIRCDLRDVSALQAAIEKVRVELGDIGVVIKNSGQGEGPRVEEGAPTYLVY